MNEVSLKPVIDELETLFSKFNKAFFEGKLEKPVITVSPDHTRGAYGWCTGWKAWQDGTKEGGYYEINLCAEYLNRPGVVVAMVVRDIEATPDCCPFDPFGGGHSELVKQSLFNITSLSPEQVSDYALNSPLGMAMKAELLSRGVNVENYLSMIEGPETL